MYLNGKETVSLSNSSINSNINPQSIFHDIVRTPLIMSLHVLSTTVKGKLGSSKTYNVDLTGKTVVITGAVSST